MLRLSTYGDKVAKAFHKQDVFIIRVQILCWTLIILCMHLMLHPYFGRDTGVYQNIFTKMSTYTIVLTCIMFLSIMISYVNELFIKQNKRILGIMSINGMSMKQLYRYLIQQGWRLHKHSIPISFCISIIILPICNWLSNYWLADTINIFDYNLHAYMGVAIIFVLVWAFLMIGDLGYIYRSEIRDLLSGAYQKDLSSLVEMPAKVLAIVSFSLSYILVTLSFPPESLFNLLKFAFLGMVATAMIILDLLPIVCKKAQYKYHMHPKKSIVFAELSIMLKAGSLLIYLLCLACGTLSIMLSFYALETDKTMVIFFCFIIMLILMDICLIQHVKSYTTQNHAQYHSLLSLGYRIQDIKSIVIDEYRYFFILVYVFAYLVTAIACYQLFRYQITTLSNICTVIFIHIVFAWFGYFLSKRFVLKHLEV